MSRQYECANRLTFSGCKLFNDSCVGGDGAFCQNHFAICLISIDSLLYDPSPEIQLQIDESRLASENKDVARNNKNSSGDKIANVNLLTTISHTRRPTSKYRKRDKPTSFNKLDDTLASTAHEV